MLIVSISHDLMALQLIAIEKCYFGTYLVLALKNKVVTCLGKNFMQIV